MLCIFNAKPGSDAGAVQAAAEALVGQACEHSPLVQERKDGCYDLRDREETRDEMFGRFAREQNVGPRVARAMFASEQPSARILTGGETRRPGVRGVAISPAAILADGSPITLDDFPKGHDFGNGVTCCATVKLSDGEIHRLSWVVFPDSAAPIVRLQLEQLRVAFEE